MFSLTIDFLVFLLLEADAILPALAWVTFFAGIICFCYTLATLYIFARFFFWPLFDDGDGETSTFSIRWFIMFL